jgi:hypothetical protein
MARAEKPKQKPSKKTQYGRFVETARSLGADESAEAFELAFSKIVPPQNTPLNRRKNRQ